MGAVRVGIASAFTRVVCAEVQQVEDDDAFVALSIYLMFNKITGNINQGENTN